MKKWSWKSEVAKKDLYSEDSKKKRQYSVKITVQGLQLQIHVPVSRESEVTKKISSWILVQPVYKSNHRIITLLSKREQSNMTKKKSHQKYWGTESYFQITTDKFYCQKIFRGKVKYQNRGHLLLRG